jgi:hypothetical protein
LHKTPPQSSPGSATIATNRAGLHDLLGYGENFGEEPPPLPPPAQTLEAHRERLPQKDQWTIDELTHSDQAAHVAMCIIRGTARAVSDGSYKNNFSTSSFAVEGTDQSLQVQGVNRAPGSPRDQSAYRGELVGISGILSLLTIICGLHDITSGHITIGLDGEGALKQTSSSKNPRARKASYDLLIDLRAKLKALPITVSWHWIKGHQDDDIFAELDRWAEINIDMDTAAKAHLATHQAFPVPACVLGNEQISVFYKGEKLARFDIRTSTGRSGLLTTKHTGPSATRSQNSGSTVSPGIA